MSGLQDRGEEYLVPGIYSPGSVAHYKQDMVSMHDYVNFLEKVKVLGAKHQIRLVTVFYVARNGIPVSEDPCYSRVC